MRTHPEGLASDHRDGGTERIRHLRRVWGWLRPARMPLGATVAALLLVAQLTAIAAPTGADTAPPQGFTTQEAPLPADAGTGSTSPNVYTASSTCAGQNSCVVVGWYDDTAGHPWGLIETQSGTSWTETESPEPADAGSGIDQGAWIGSQGCGVTSPCDAVSCPAANSCWAVGEYINTSGERVPFIENGFGGNWTATAAPLPSDMHTGPRFGFLRSLDCLSTTFCVAVGIYEDAAGHDVPLIETLSSAGWSAQTVTGPSDISTTSPDMFVADVSCSSPTSCIAPGSYNATTGTKGLLLSLSGSTWTSTSAPEPSDARTTTPSFADLYDSTCTASGTCVVVGQYETNVGGFAGLIETGSGSSWTPTVAPVPSDTATGASERVTLFGISCGSSWVCTTVGSYNDGHGRGWGLIDSSSWGSWTAAKAPQPSDAASPTAQDAALQTVSCPSPAFCMTTGFYLTSGGFVTGLLDTLWGGTWSGMPVPLPSNYVSSPTQPAFGRVVSCYSASACAIGGWYPDSSGHVQGFLDTFTGLQGYWLVASDGGIFSYGNAQFHGSAGSLRLNAPVVGAASSPDRWGYWTVASDGGIFNYGDAGFYGSRGGQPLNKPIVGMASTATGKGYWLVASDGGIFSYGDAQFYGSTGGMTLNAPIVGMAATPSGKGYWLVASDGGIFSYGDAQFYGSTGSLKLNKPVVSMASTPTGLGYWLVASDGGIFNYGDARFYGSTGSMTLNKPVVGMASSPTGLGYWLVASDGGIFNYGDAQFYGSTGSMTLNRPVVAMADG